MPEGDSPPEEATSEAALGAACSLGTSGGSWAEVTDTSRWSNRGISSRQGRDRHFVVEAHDPSIP